MNARQPRRNNHRTVFAVPTAVALSSIFGLVAALTGEGWRDVLSWMALTVPVAAVVWAIRHRRS